MDATLQILGGLALLAAGGEGVIRGAVGIARRLGLSELLIGLVLVGFGTSTPELITSLDAALRGSPGIAVGNVFGSNIANVLLIMGAVALIRPMAVARAAIGRDGMIAVGAAMALAALALVFGELTRALGALLVVLLLTYVGAAWRLERKGGPAAAVHRDEAHLHDPPPGRLWLATLMASGALGLLVIGADLLVSGAVAVARVAGVSETVIGLTIVAIGTSLPELVATLAAALRGRNEVAFGTIVGSNIYNIFGILGVTALVHPLAIPDDIGVVDWAMLIGSAALLLLFARTGARITRLEGGVLLALYGGYIAYLLSR